ncbi:MAG: nucleotidyltransferase family protein [Methanotrichaceae archaeon]|nr:nucleotidyltransferase family protein [Methanotrichaceae archaeon]
MILGKSMSIQLEGLLISPDSTILEAMACIDRNAKGIMLVVDDETHLIGTITDGDIRRSILAGIDLNFTVQNLLDHRATAYHPITAPIDTPKSSLIRLMNEYSIRHIPLLDEKSRVVDLALLSDLVKDYNTPLTAVIMAGGLGTRLRPLTNDLPKPMLPVGDRPIMDHLITSLQNAGIRIVNITTHYKPDKIREYFRDGHDFGVKINYVSEDRPLGTAGGLGLMPAKDETLLVINGDILTQLNFRAMLDYHKESRADMTIAVRKYDLHIPYGIVECDGPKVHRVQEKPLFSFFVNAGIYMIEPIVHSYIPNNRRFDMTDLISCLLNESLTVVSFPVIEYWLDIGQHEDYERAQLDMLNGRCTL